MVTWPKWQPKKERVAQELKAFTAGTCPLPGIADPRALSALAMQFVASLRREAYYRLLQRKRIAPSRANPNHPSFDAERAVAYHLQQGNVDEACWVIFLMTHFAKPADTGWLRLRDVYGKLGNGVWDWKTVEANPQMLENWMQANWKGIRGKYGNHRKYESMRPTANRAFSRVVGSYISWIGPKGHAKFFADAVRTAGNDPSAIFDYLYQRLSVLSFGRLAKFDYLALIGRFGVAPVSAGSAYLDQASGPASGARLLIDGAGTRPSTTRQLQQVLDQLDLALCVGMEVMEDALCNWQKSPNKFVHFKG